MSPRAGVVIKPVDPLSLYGSYSVSYLPASGDQFGALTVGHHRVAAGKVHQQGSRLEVGHQPAADLHHGILRAGSREHADPGSGGTGIVVAAGHSRVKGIEAGLAGYVTDKWQISAGYANLDARFVTDTSNAAGAVAAGPAPMCRSCRRTPTRCGTAMTSITIGV